MITQKRLKELLTYDQETGVFIWNVNRRGGRAKIGYVAGQHDRKGYLRIGIEGNRYQGHHLAWLYVFGFMPEQIDHKNEAKGDNRICNLREATTSENTVFSKVNSIIQGRKKGCSFHKCVGKWQSAITRNGKKRWLGCFDSQVDARNAYLNAAGVIK